jgi:hypothetical protein
LERAGERSQKKIVSVFCIIATRFIFMEGVKKRKNCRKMAKNMWTFMMLRAEMVRHKK